MMTVIDTTMTFIEVIVGGLLVWKIVWNVGTPFALASRALKTFGEAKGGISLCPQMEIGLLLLFVLLSAITNGTGLLHEPKMVALWGACAVVGSYVLMAVLGIILGSLIWLVSMLEQWRQR
jgi:hypothetical protein